MTQIIPKIEFPQAKIQAFCKKWKITELALFGSVLREDFSSKSDVDMLVTFLPETHYGLFDLVHMQNELAEILNRNVDLVEKKSVEQSKNYIRRKHILNSFQPLYAA